MRLYFGWIWLAALVATTCLVGCGPSGPRSPHTIARIGGEPVPYEEFDEFLRKQAGPGVSDLGANVMSRLLDQFLSERLLLRLAVDRGLVGPDTGSWIEPGSGAIRRRAAEALLSQEESEPVTRAEIERYYADHASGFRLPPRVRLRHLVTEERQAAMEARRRVAAGEEFTAVAREVSTAPSAADGGLEGVVARDDLPFPFTDPISSTAAGEMTEVIEASDGFHLFLVEARLAAETVPLETALEAIRERLEQKRTDRRLAELVLTARRRYTVVVYEENLPFPYRGSFAEETE